MNQQKMIEHIATEVMGWRFEPNHHPFEPFYVVDESSPDVLWQHEYNPFENHRQAFEALDKLDWYALDKNTDISGYVEYTCVVGDPFENGATSPDLLHAICIAICRATGYVAEE